VARGSKPEPRSGAAVDVLHVFDLPWDYLPYPSKAGMELEQRIEGITAARLGGLRERLAATGVAASLHTRRGRPWLRIAEAADELGAQLVALGTRGRTGLEHALLGSVAERTLRLARGSVLVVKGLPETA
jgi:nucleotide-binding universal stress UspA family protein